MEAAWDTQPEGTCMPILAVPSDAKECNSLEIGTIPKLASLLAYGSTKPIKGLREFKKEDRPPVALTFYSFRLMVGIGTLMLLMCGWAAYVSLRNRLDSSSVLLRVMLWSIPLPLHRGAARMDCRGGGTPALAGLWLVQNISGRVEITGALSGGPFPGCLYCCVPCFGSRRFLSPVEKCPERTRQGDPG